MDRISALPQDTIEKILTLMPLRDALRTNILSSKWRYCWTSMPSLAFDVLDVSSDNEEFNKHKIVKDMFHVLIQHVGPILDFSIHINEIEIANEVDPMILHLSRSNNIKKFSFVKWPKDCYILPISFFSLQGLEHLVLMGCVIKPPLMFNGFSMLRSLCFKHCMITVKVLLRFLRNCPQLEEFTLVVTQSIDVKKCVFVELFKCLASVQVLKMCRLWIKDDEISCLFCVINSSPSLEKIKVEMCWDHEECGELDFENLFDLEGHSDLNLNHLKELEITNFNNVAHEMEFVKLIMAKSHVLKLAHLKLNAIVCVDDVIKMFQDLVGLPFPRASPTANFIIERMPLD